MNENKREITYFNQNGKYLVYTIEGESFILESKTEFDKYVKENNCKVVKN